MTLMLKMLMFLVGRTWEFYKPRVKGIRAYQDSLLEVMDNFGKKKQYMEANPHHYFPDGKHPNKVLHKV